MTTIQASIQNITQQVYENTDGNVGGDQLQQVLIGIHKALLFQHPAGNLQPGDVRKLVMNTAGLAEITMPGPGVAGQPGVWEYFCVGLTKPEQTGYEILLTSQPSPGNTFKFADTIFTFAAAVPSNNTEVQIGNSLQETIDNIASTFANHAPQKFINISSESGKVICDAGYDYIGAEGDSVAFDAQTTADISLVITSNGQDNSYGNINDYILRVDIEGSVQSIYISEICDIGAPEGVQVGSNYRWPETGIQVARNLAWVLENVSGLISGKFSVTEVTSTLFQINELTAPTTQPTEVQNTPSGPDIFQSLTQTDYSFPPLAGTVTDVVLGKLEYLENGTAYISKDRIMRLLLAPGVSVTFDTMNPSSFQNRLLFAGADGYLYPPPVPMTEAALMNGEYLALEEVQSDPDPDNPQPREITVERIYIPS